MAKRNSTGDSWGIHWFRRDLRIDGNRGFVENFTRHHGRIIGLFCFDSKFLIRPDFSHRRFAFFIETIKALRVELQSVNVELLVIDCQPLEAFREISAVARRNECELPFVSLNRDYEPFALKRDQAVTEELEKNGFGFETYRDHLLFEPDEILKADRTPFQKYSAFAAQWRRLLVGEGKKRIEFESGLNLRKSRANVRPHVIDILDEIKKSPSFKESLEEFDRENRKHFSGPLPEAGHAAAIQQLQNFKKNLPKYLEQRSIPSCGGSSELSKFLKNGSLTLSQVLDTCELQKNHASASKDKFLSELIWREYYFYILYHFPHVEIGPFYRKYEHIRWKDNTSHLKAWQSGKTGVPIVDAGMRELNETGFINNRVRIIVAAFLTKDLYLNWQEGERYFMNQLIDGDLAANNGNWQWVASTGSENQPYFRVMNPWLQSEKFDPRGEYIKRWVPELMECKAKDLHKEDGDRASFDYPTPIVDHLETKKFAIEDFKRFR